jgi:HPt (histidine-containing phosphotransfer) domain-containing protein
MYMSNTTINTDALLNLRQAIGGDLDDLLELLDDFYTSTPELAESLTASVAAGDLTSARIAAHTLKSNAREFGATDLESLCGALEKQCLAGEVVNGDEQAASIKIALSDAIVALKQLDFQHSA